MSYELTREDHDLFGPTSGRELVVLDAPGERAIVGEPFDGASRFAREMARWRPEIRMPDQEVIPNIDITNSRTRDAARNDALIKNGVNLNKDSIVGSHFMLTSNINSKLLVGKEDPKWEDEVQEEIESRFTLYAESPDNWVDASRKMSLTQMIRLAVGLHTLSGEVLATGEWLRDEGENRPFNTAVQMVDIDRLSTPNDLMADLAIRGGVRRNPRGAPQGYYIRNAHPRNYQDPGIYDWTYSPIRKPWGRMQVIHMFEMERPDQSRGIAEMVGALKETRMTKKWRDLAIQNAVLNATYAASIESDLPTEAIFQRLGGATMDNQSMTTALNGYVGAWMTQIAAYMGGAENLKLDGVKIPHLPPGAKLQLRPAGSGGPLGTDFEASLLRYLAASFGTSYEEFSKNFSNTNYSGFKGALAQTGRTMQAKKKATADRLATYIFRLWFEEAFNNGRIETLKRRKAINIYEGQNFDIVTACSWIGASLGQVDELKETQAAVLRINSGLSTMEKECARLGIDWRVLVRQLKREKDWKDFYKVLQDPPDTKNMMNAAQGNKNTKDDGDA